MERSNNFKAATLTWDEMDEDSFYMSGGQYCGAARKTV